MNLMTLSIFTLALLSGCTAEMAYHSGQEWQRNACYKIANPSERERCLNNFQPSYEEYQRQIKQDKTKPEL